MATGDYTDFYAGNNHAFNEVALFRSAASGLQPNYLHIPVGYHGRASSVVISGTPIRRLTKQIILDATATPTVPSFGPCRTLDIDSELGCLLCTGNKMGEPIRIGKDAEEAIFGFVPLNDWSARDIQKWEYVPLGPFNGKNFAASISPWIVLACAPEPFPANKLENKSEILKYLKERDDTTYNIQLEVDLTTPDGGDDDDF